MKRIVNRAGRGLILALSALLVAAALLTACASGPDIRTDYDRSVDFSQYKTYNLFKPMGIENPNYSTIYGSVFRDALSRDTLRAGGPERPQLS